MGACEERVGRASWNTSTLRATYITATSVAKYIHTCAIRTHDDASAMCCPKVAGGSSNLHNYNFVQFQVDGVLQCIDDELLSLDGATYCAAGGDNCEYDCEVDGLTIFIDLTGTSISVVIRDLVADEVFFAGSTDCTGDFPLTVTNNFAIGDCGDTWSGSITKEGYDGTVIVRAP